MLRSVRLGESDCSVEGRRPPDRHSFLVRPVVTDEGKDAADAVPRLRLRHFTSLPD